MSKTTPPSAPSPIRPSLRLTGAAETLTLHADCPPRPDVIGAVCEALHDLLPMDTSRRERRSVPLDDAFSWLLQWSELRLSVTVIDQAGSPWCPATTVNPAHFLDALYRADLGQTPRLLRALDRLRAWFEALDQGDTGPSPDSPRPTTGPIFLTQRTERPSASPLAAADLRHLAYRETWASFSHGTVAIFPQADRIQVFDRDGLHILCKETGQQLAFEPKLYPAGAPNLALDADARLTALDADGAVRWRTIPTVEGSPKHTVSTDEIVLVEADHSTLSAYDAVTGQLRWRHRAFHGGATIPTITGDLLWRFARDGFLYGLWAASGDPYCRRRVLGRPVAPPMVTPRGVVTTAAVDDALQITHYDNQKGAPIWGRRIRGRLAAGPVSFAGGLALIVERDGRQALHSLNESDGSQRSHHLLDDPTDTLRLDVIGELILTKSATGVVQGFSQSSGRPLWRLGADTAHHAPWARLGPISTRGVLLCAGASIRAVDPKTGRLIQTLECAESAPSWVSAWPNGDLLLLEDDELRLFRLCGHLSLVGA